LDWEASFLAAAKRRGLRPSTLDNYRDKLHVLRIHNIDLKRCSGRSLVRVLDVFSNQKASYYRDLAIFVRMVLKFLGRRDLIKFVEIPKGERRVEKIREKVLGKKDVMRLIQKAPRLVDRLLVELFYETGARVGEILNLFSIYLEVAFSTSRTWLLCCRIHVLITPNNLYSNRHHFTLADRFES
jgi:integrase